MNKDNLIIFAVAALAVFGVYKMTRTTKATTTGAINNTSVGVFTPWYGGNLPTDLWGLGFKTDAVNWDPTYTGPFQMTDLTKEFHA